MEYVSEIAIVYLGGQHDPIFSISLRRVGVILPMSGNPGFWGCAACIEQRRAPGEGRRGRRVVVSIPVPVPERIPASTVGTTRVARRSNFRGLVANCSFVVWCALVDLTRMTIPHTYLLVSYNVS